MTVSFDRAYELLHSVNSGCILKFGKDVCRATPTADEFFGKGPQIDRLLRPIASTSVQKPGSNFVLNDYSHFPPSGIVSWSDFERSDRIDFTQVFAFGVSQMKLAANRDIRRAR